MVNTRQQLVTGSARNQSAGTNPRTSITIHDTGNSGKGANASAHANLQSRGNSRTASWHWTVDDREAVQSYPHTAKCWHAGNGRGNNTSISIEICVNSDGDYSKTLQNAAELTAIIMKQEKLGIGALVQHNRWSGKNCPAQIRAGRAGVNWTTFLSMVNNALNGTSPSTPAPSNPNWGTPEPPKPSPTAPVVDKPVSNPFILSVQHALRAADYYKGDLDGVQGAVMTDAIRRYQANQRFPKLYADGVWGTVTDQHYHWTRELQTAMNKWKAVSPKLRVDGDYGAEVVKQLRNLQSRNGLYADGIAGSKSTAKLGIRNHP